MKRTHVAAIVGVLGVAASSNGSGGSDAAVDGVDGAESVNVKLQVGQGLIRAGLERGGVTSSSGIESVGRSENSVSIPAGTTSTGVSGDKSARWVPV